MACQDPRPDGRLARSSRRAIRARVCDPYLDPPTHAHSLRCAILTSLINSDLHAELFPNLGVPDEPISPSQTILLKILDSHLASPDRPDPAYSANGFLIPLFHSLARYGLMSMRTLADDARLPKVFEGLVLVCEALSSIGLAVQARRDEARLEGREVELGGDERLVEEMKSVEEDVGIVKPIISESFPFDKTDGWIPISMLRPLATTK